MSNIPARIRHIRKQLGIEAEQLPARKNGHSICAS
jgi:hypothetical protein